MILDRFAGIGEGVTWGTVRSEPQFVNNPHGNPVFYQAPAGSWVRYSDAAKAIKEARKLVQRLPAEPAAQDKRTEQLLNELYHDRARLERVLKDAVMLVSTLKDVIDGEPMFAAKTGRQLGESEAQQWAAGLAQQFTDTHGE